MKDSDLGDRIFRFKKFLSGFRVNANTQFSGKVILVDVTLPILITAEEVSLNRETLLENLLPSFFMMRPCKA